MSTSTLKSPGPRITAPHCRSEGPRYICCQAGFALQSSRCTAKILALGRKLQDMAECSSEEYARSLTNPSSITCLSRGEAIGLTVSSIAFKAQLASSLLLLGNSPSWVTLSACSFVCTRDDRGMFQLNPILLVCTDVF